MEKQEKENSSASGRKKHRRRRRRMVLLSILGVLVLFRLMLPYIVKHYVNKKLQSLEEYTGQVGDIDIALLRGAYVIRDLDIEKIQKAEKGQKESHVPFFSAPVVDLSVEWRALFKGAIVGEIYVEKPVLNFEKGVHKAENARTDTTDFKQLIRALMPLTVNHFEITGGEIHYIDPYAKPNLDVYMSGVNVFATNISNVNDSTKLLPAHLEATGLAYEGNFRLNVDFDGLAKVPTFDLNAELNDMNIVKLNDFLRAYGNFEARSGRIGLYTEFAAKEGKFGGYVKPVIKNLDVVQLEGDVKQVIWEMIVGAASRVLQNPSEEQVATKVDIEGRFDSPGINLWRAISLVLRNAFVRALKPSIDNSINIHHLEDEKNKTLLEKVFGGVKKIGNKEKK